MLIHVDVRMAMGRAGSLRLYFGLCVSSPYGFVYTFKVEEREYVRQKGRETHCGPLSLRVTHGTAAAPLAP